MTENLTRLTNQGILTIIVACVCRVHTSLINVRLVDELYLFMARQLIVNVSSLFMDDTRNLMAESVLLRFIDVHKIGDDIQLHVKFLKED